VNLTQSRKQLDNSVLNQNNDVENKFLGNMQPSPFTFSSAVRDSAPHGEKTKSTRYNTAAESVNDQKG